MQKNKINKDKSTSKNKNKRTDQKYSTNCTFTHYNIYATYHEVLRELPFLLPAQENAVAYPSRAAVVSDHFPSNIEGWSLHYIKKRKTLHNAVMLPQDDLHVLSNH